MSKAVPKILIVVFLSLIIFDFVSFKLRIKNPMAFWRKQWFMFSFSDDKLSKLIIVGTLQNGERIVVPMGRWFKYFVGFETSRYNEVSRRQEALGQLADYVCREYNKSVPAPKKIAKMTIHSVVWKQELGHRRELKDIPSKDVRLYPHISNRPCPHE